jgi:putative FmdB family regulatory protein
MPIFEYKCGTCGHVVEVLHKSLKAKAPACEKCGAEMGKLLSGFAVGRASESPSCDSCASLPACGGCAGGACPMPMG